MNFCVLYGSVREARLGIGLARCVTKALEERGHTAYLLDPMTLKLPLLDKRLIDYDLKDSAPQVLLDLQKKFQGMDALILVSGEYNNGMPPALKNVLDHFNRPDFDLKAAGLITYSIGDFGGIRSIPDLRSITATLGMIALPQTFSVPKMQDKVTPDGDLKDDKTQARFDKFLESLFWLTNTLKQARN